MVMQVDIKCCCCRRRWCRCNYNSTQFYNKGYSKTLENLTAFDNCKRYRFNLNGLYSNIRLGFNAKVAIDYVAVPRSNYATTTTFKYVRLCGVSDNVYDTERKGNNNPIIHINKANNLLTDITFLKNLEHLELHLTFYQKDI
jgi:hypothetical protein